MGLNIKDLKISTPAFEQGGRIPTRHTGEGEDVSPALEWQGVPEGTRQLSVICHDPDAPLPHGFTHWVIYGIPAGATGIPEGGGSAHTEGMSDFGKTGYGGPMPPPGHGDHHYYFWVYALDTEIDAAPGLTRHELLERIQDHVIEQNRIVGTYSR
ncbi:MAG: YbhB/YbcL family Raf kinase inhibitor-like protein [Nitriliruptorales bacterium]|nr:YbhB/YbcL family Raf kinase inhibitor-like protein [Nitriliruptorales bacterium]